MCVCSQTVIHASKLQLRMVAVQCGDLEGRSTTNIASPFCESVFQQSAGRPTKYECSWSSANKGIYLAELTKKLRATKSSYRFSSDDAAIHHQHLCCCLTPFNHFLEIIIYNIITSLTSMAL